MEFRSVNKIHHSGELWCGRIVLISKRSADTPVSVKPVPLAEAQAGIALLHTADSEPTLTRKKDSLYVQSHVIFILICSRPKVQSKKPLLVIKDYCGDSENTEPTKAIMTPSPKAERTLTPSKRKTRGLLRLPIQVNSSINLTGLRAYFRSQAGFLSQKESHTRIHHPNQPHFRLTPLKRSFQGGFRYFEKLLLGVLLDTIFNS